MNNNFSTQVKEVISYSREEAERLGSGGISTGHLLLGMIKEDHNTALDILKRFAIDLPELKMEIEGSLETVGEMHHESPAKVKFFKFSFKSNRGMALNKEAELAIRESVSQANNAQCRTIEVEHLMLSILKNTEDRSAKILCRLGVDYDRVSLQLRQV